MSDELRITYQGTGTLYAVARKLSDGTVWSVAGTAWATYADGSIDSYDVALASKGGDLYTADLPTDIAAGIKMWIVYYKQAGDSPAITDYVLGSEDMTSGESVEGGSGTATYNLSTNIGKLRLAIGDTDVVPSTDAIFLDEELQIFLDRVDTASVESALIPVAAAGEAMLQLAAGGARQGKMLRTGNFSKDTRTAAREMREMAGGLFERAGLPKSGQPAQWGATEVNWGPFSADTILANQATRE